MKFIELDFSFLGLSSKDGRKSIRKLSGLYHTGFKKSKAFYMEK